MGEVVRFPDNMASDYAERTDWRGNPTESATVIILPVARIERDVPPNPVMENPVHREARALEQQKLRNVIKKKTRPRRRKPRAPKRNLDAEEKAFSRMLLPEQFKTE